MRHAGNVRAPDRELAHALRARVLQPAQGERPAVGRATDRDRASSPTRTCSSRRSTALQEAGRLRDARQARGAKRGAKEPRRRSDAGAGLPTRQLIQPDCPLRPQRARPARRGARGLLLTMADDEFVIGFWDSEWTGIAPMLEEDVAFSSLAQDEIGHARVLYELLARADRRGSGPRSPSTGTRRVPPRRLLDHPRTDWAFTDRAALAVRNGRRGAAGGAGRRRASRRSPVVAKIRREERYHLMHLDAWLQRLAEAPMARQRPARALEALAPDALTVFTPLPGEAVLVDAGDPGGAHGRTGGRRWRRKGGPRCDARPAVSGPAAGASGGRSDRRPDEWFRWLWNEFTSVARLGGWRVVAPGVRPRPQSTPSGPPCMTCMTRRSRPSRWSTWASCARRVEEGRGRSSRGAAAHVRRLPGDRCDARGGARAAAALAVRGRGRRRNHVRRAVDDERISDAGRAQLRASGFAPPLPGGAPSCSRSCRPPRAPTAVRATRPRERFGPTPVPTPTSLSVAGQPSAAFQRGGLRARADTTRGTRPRWVPRQVGGALPSVLPTAAAMSAAAVPSSRSGFGFGGYVARLKVLLVGAGTVGEAIAKLAAASRGWSGWCSPTTTSTGRARSRRCSATEPQTTFPAGASTPAISAAVVQLAREPRRRPGHERRRSALRARLRWRARGRRRLHGHGGQPVRAACPPIRSTGRASCSATASSPGRRSGRRGPPGAPRAGHGPRPDRGVRALRRRSTSSTRSTRSTSATAATCASRATASRRSSPSGRPSRSASTRPSSGSAGAASSTTEPFSAPEPFVFPEGIGPGRVRQRRARGGHPRAARRRLPAR